MIMFYIDEIVPCLKEIQTGEIYETEVIRIKRKSILSKYNERTGWIVNWDKFSSDTEIYALVLKGTFNVQGLIAIQYDDSAKAVHLRWGCVSSENNIWKNNTQRFLGVGGHLLAIAAELSCRHGYEGYLYGEAMDEKLFHYLCSNFGAFPLPALHGCTNRFMIPKESTDKIREVYTYEWTDDIG